MVEKLIPIYHHFRTNELICTSELNAFGYTSVQIQSLVNLEIIKRVKRGYYVLIDRESLKEFETEFSPISKNSTTSSENNVVVNLETLIGLLSGHNFDKFIFYLQKFLKEYEKEKYQLFIYDLVKISIYEKDSSFAIVSSLLSHIRDEKLQIDISYFLQQFYIQLANRNFTLASLYLSLLQKVHEFGAACEVLEDLKQILNRSENIIDRRNKPELIQEFEKIILPFNRQREENNIPIPDSQKINCPGPQLEPKKKGLSIDTNSILEVVKRVLEETEIFIFPSMNNDETEETINFLSTIEGIAYLIINSDEGKQIVVRPRQNTNSESDLSILKQDAKLSYLRGDYQEAIRLNKTILSLIDFPRSLLFSKIAHSYTFMGVIDKAILYFTVALSITMTEKEPLLYIKDLLATLKVETYPKKDVCHGELQVTKERYEVINTSTIPNFADIIHLVVNFGYDVKEACHHYGIEDEIEIEKIELGYLQYLYQNECYDIASKLVRQIERRSTTSKNTRGLLRIMKTRRRDF